MGKKRRKVTTNHYFDKRKLKYLKQVFPAEIIARLVETWEGGTRANNEVIIGSFYKFSTNYYTSVDVVYTPDELIRYIDKSEERFFELQIKTKGKEKLTFRFKVVLRFIHKRYLIETLSSIRRKCKDESTKAELRKEILRIRNCKFVPVTSLHTDVN